jgi:hypothetical protein
MKLTARIEALHFSCKNKRRDFEGLMTTICDEGRG